MIVVEVGVGRRPCSPPHGDLYTTGGGGKTVGPVLESRGSCSVFMQCNVESLGPDRYKALERIDGAQLDWSKGRHRFGVRVVPR